jgi:hypothetical protein
MGVETCQAWRWQGLTLCGTINGRRDTSIRSFGDEGFGERAKGDYKCSQRSNAVHPRAVRITCHNSVPPPGPTE